MMCFEGDDVLLALFFFFPNMQRFVVDPFDL